MVSHSFCVVSFDTVVPFGTMRHQAKPQRRTPDLHRAVILDLSKPGEKSAHDFLLRATSGRFPLFHTLSMRRRGSLLLLAIETAHGSAYVMTLSLVTNTLSLRQWYLSHTDAKEAVAAFGRRVGGQSSLLSRPSSSGA